MSIKSHIMKIKVLLIALIFSTLLFSCRKIQETPPNSDATMTELVIPNSFNFETTKSITLTINDATEASYDVYSITTDAEPEVIYTTEDTIINIDNSNQRIASGFTKNGSWQVSLKVPKYQEHLYIKRKQAGAFYGEMIAATEGNINYTFSSSMKSKRIADEDIIYASNGSGEAFYFDLATGTSTLLANFPNGANACAVDKANNVMYVAERRSPYRLRSINLTSGEQIVIGELKKNFDRMVYDKTSGILYVGSKNRLYSYDPFSAQFITQYNLSGSYKNYSGGDVSIGPDGNFYFTAYNAKVLYKGVFNGNKIETTGITNNLPTITTSSTIGSDGYLYYATNTTPSKVYKVNIQTGEAELLYTLSQFKANDFGAFFKDEIAPVDDTDNDGVPDTEDEYPDDPDRAFNIWTPGENQWGTLAFEDLWPGMGDYDFNDMVVNYKFQQVTNADNKVVDIKGYFNNIHEGASLINGFGFELPIAANLVSNVSGYNITDNAVSLSGNGTEAGQTNAVIIVFDNGDVNLNTVRTVTINLTEPINQNTLGDAPYNPFLIKDQDRDYEIHLPDHAPTTLADNNILGTANDNSIPAQGRYYKTQNNLPWVINIPVEFVWPKEKVEILNGYLKFQEWAESGGSLFPDWYKDLTGYRDENNLDI